MRWWWTFFTVLVVSMAAGSASAQCAPAPDSPYFFKELTQRREQAKVAEDRAFFENLLSATFVNRARFIDGALNPEHSRPDKPDVMVRNFSLLEHRKGFVVTSYELVDGKVDHWFRDVYQVEDGRWRLASSEIVPPGSQVGGT